ncbi:MAG: hypothetical protein CM15mP120_10780 [Pseudomonadota bacterium]|nr:MAG: hypothetical protein CM15mP120_10780 [Pseudomonadota bacterium]
MAPGHTVLATYELSGADAGRVSDDVTADMAPMGIIPDSHNGPLYDL